MEPIDLMQINMAAVAIQEVMRDEFLIRRELSSAFSAGRPMRDVELPRRHYDRPEVTRIANCSQADVEFVYL